MFFFVDGESMNHNGWLLAALVMKFQSVVVRAVLFLVLMMLFGLAIPIVVYALVIVPEGSSVTRSYTFDFAHVITEFGFRLPAA